MDITIQELREQYDAVLITIGASTDKKLGLPGEDADGVLSAVQFLRSVGKDEIIDLTGKKSLSSAAERVHGCGPNGEETGCEEVSIYIEDEETI